MRRPNLVETSSLAALLRRLLLDRRLLGLALDGRDLLAGLDILGPRHHPLHRHALDHADIRADGDRDALHDAVADRFAITLLAEADRDEEQAEGRHHHRENERKPPYNEFLEGHLAEDGGVVGGDGRRLDGRGRRGVHVADLAEHDLVDGSVSHGALNSSTAIPERGDV